MRSPDLNLASDSVLADRRLLDHPFYRRWERGEVSMAELAAYAGQYRHFEGFLPGFLTRLVASLPEGDPRELVAANLADELGDPVAHTELFEGFAAAVGGAPAAATPATSDLLSTYDGLLAEGPLAALAGFVAYESQASDVAQRKAEGLRHHYGLDEHAVSFWAHHAAVDALHGEWALRALDELTARGGRDDQARRRAADAWWSFLDERQAFAEVS